jgi:ATPase subunit of ABC transporter with duplicated ATPase domains
MRATAELMMARRRRSVTAADLVVTKMQTYQPEVRPGGVSIRVLNLSFSYGDRTILDGASFTMDNTRRSCLVGKNGVGKSTLLRILARELHASGGRVIASNPRYTVEYVPQIIPVVDEATGALDQLLEASGVAEKVAKLEFYHQHVTEPGLMDDFEEFVSQHDEAQIYASVQRVRVGLSSFVGLASSEGNKPLRELSGGQKARLFILQALTSRPDLLLLDEPDNNLDSEGREWLIGEIREYPNTVLVVGHRIEFVDQLADRVLELSDRDHKIYAYTGNYSSYLEAKAGQEELDERERLQIEKERRRLRAAIQKQLRLAARSQRGPKRRRDRDKMAAKHKSARAAQKHQEQAATLKKRLATLPDIERPKHAELKIDLEPAHCGQNVVVVAGVSKAYRRSLFEDFSSVVRRGDRVAIVGPNASGKTTLLKIIAGLAEPDEGEVKLAKGVVVGYLPQEQEGLPDMTVLDYFRNTVAMDVTSLRRELFHYLFTVDEVSTNIQSLSAGERVRLFLVQFALSHANLLLLDEPTNNLDAASRDRLAKSLMDYAGTILVVSHDEGFLEKLSIDKTLRLGGGRVQTEYGLALEPKP